MLESQSHQQLKVLLKQGDASWPHHLTLSRLVGRSLRRRDTTLLQLSPCSGSRWWLGLLVPLCLQPGAAALVVDASQRQHLLQRELPRLRQQGLRLACWQGSNPPPGDQLWLLDEAELLAAYRNNQLGERQLLVPDADLLSQRLRRCMSLQITSEDWERLRQSHPEADAALVDLHDRMSRQVFGMASRTDALVRINSATSQALRDLLRVIGPCPSPWADLLSIHPDQWAEWAVLDHRMLQWSWQLEPLEPLEVLQGLLSERPVLLLSASGDSTRLDHDLQTANVQPQVTARLKSQELDEPLPLYAPRRQPLPNTEIYANHLLEQSRRLILGRTGLTVVLIDDQQLRRQLTSALAAEFGRRVMEQSTAPDSNGVISASWSWWLNNHNKLPAPDQIIVGMLPLASLCCPLTAARVERMKSRGSDWFRMLLLPEALNLIPQAVAPLRLSKGRLAILDGRLRGRSWGEKILQILDPWVPPQRLLPD